MQKSKDPINTEPVSDEFLLEEVADIPEKVSLEKRIDSEGEPETNAMPDADFEGGEELGDIKLSVTESRPVIDEYAGPGGNTLKQRPYAVSDVSSLASEVDILTRVSKMEKGPVGAKVEKLADSPNAVRLKPAAESRERDAASADQEETAADTNNEIVIYEDDDIDIDYYSLEELEGTASPDMMDMPEAAVAPDVDRQADKKTQADEFEEETMVSKGEKEAVARAEKDILTFEIPDDVREKTTEAFELGEWEAIDLGEAEKIANEDILFLREDDLIEELEEFDLMPVTAESVKKKKPAKPETSSPSPPDKNAGTAVKEPEKPGDDGTKKTATGTIVSGSGHPSRAGEKPLAENPEFIPEIGVGEIVIEPELEERAAPAAKGDVISVSMEDTGPGEREEIDDGVRGGDKSVERAGVEVAHIKDTENEIHAIDIDEEGEVVTVRLEDAARTTEMPRPAGKERMTEYTPPPEPSLPAPAPRVAAAITRESIPEELLRFESPAGGAVFIDDELVDKKPAEKPSIFEVSELERITSEIVEIIEGEARVLVEADVADDRDRIASVMKGQTPAFEDLLIDMEGEYSFKDEEMDVIDNAFAAEDYGRYIGAIDEFAESGSEKSISSAVELLGLDAGELGSMEQISFLKEYEKIDVDGILASVQAGMDQPAGDLEILKRCTYVVPTKNSILEEERESIEEDISSGSALLLEESVDELRGRLDDIRARRCASPEEGFPDISDSVIIIENGRDIERFVESMPEGKRDVMRKLLKYLDGLFERLPEDVIKKFAKSEYFDLYSKVMNDLGV